VWVRPLGPAQNCAGQSAATQRETTQAGEKTFEKISFKAHFSTANMLTDDKVLARLFGVGPQLCALESVDDRAHGKGNCRRKDSAARRIRIASRRRRDGATARAAIRGSARGGR